MRTLQVHFQPPARQGLVGHAVAVIDCLRATTVQTTLIARGATVHPCETLAAGTDLRAAIPGSVLAAEVNALRPPEADYGNSPSEFAALDMRGRRVVHVTSNGTRALLATAEADTVFVACLRNRAAVAGALARATAQAIAIVCAGERDATAPSVDDAFTAGALVEALLAELPDAPTLAAGARLARRIFAAYDGDPAAAFADSPHADHLRRVGFGHDLSFCGAMDAETVVPVLTWDDGGRPLLRPAP